MPKLGLTMTEGIVAEWKARSGDHVTAGDVLFCVETEKAIVDIEAEASGVFRRGSISVGDVVVVGMPVATIEGSDTMADTRPAKSVASEHGSGVPVSRRDAEAAARVDVQPAHAGRTVATPYARVLARERQVDLRRVRGSGPNGRIKAVDVARTRDIDAHAVRASRHCSLTAEVDMSALEGLRSKLNQDATLPHLPLTPFVIAAAGRALAELPAANRVWKRGESVQLGDSAVTAVQTSAEERRARVIGDAGRKSVEQIAAELREMPIVAQSAGGAGHEIADAAMAVHVAACERVAFYHPAIVDDQSLVLAIGSLRDGFRADAERRPVPCRQVGMVLTGDARVVDDATCIAVLSRIANYLEAPYRLLCRL